MQFYVISDNHDTLAGLRLAGIDGVVAHTVAEVKSALDTCRVDESIGIVLITERLVALCPDMIYDLKLSARRPLIVEIPDRHAAGRTKDSISRYVRDAIGVKI